MKEKIILDKDYALVSYDAVQKLGQIIWRREPSAGEYKTAYLTLLNFASAETVHYFLSDIREQGGALPNERRWFEQELLPAVCKTGLIKAAVVFDGSLSRKYYINLLIAAGKKFGIPIKIFCHQKNALAWLLGATEELSENSMSRQSQVKVSGM